MTATTITQPVSDAHLQEAIQLMISECFPAMLIANSLGGSSSVPWTLVRQHSLADLVADALDRLLPVKEFKAAVTGTPFMDCKQYYRIREQIGGRVDFPR